jgi:hypothetical protein
MREPPRTFWIATKFPEVEIKSKCVLMDNERGVRDLLSKRRRGRGLNPPLGNCGLLHYDLIATGPLMRAGVSDRAC